MTALVDRLRIDVLWHQRRGNETIARDCQEAADEIERLRAALVDTLDFVEHHSSRWDACNGKHPMEVVTASRQALRLGR